MIEISDLKPFLAGENTCVLIILAPTVYRYNIFSKRENNITPQVTDFVKESIRSERVVFVELSKVFGNDLFVLCVCGNAVTDDNDT